jgi:hypothetical protein
MSIYVLLLEKKIKVKKNGAGVLFNLAKYTYMDYIQQQMVRGIGPQKNSQRFNKEK